MPVLASPPNRKPPSEPDLERKAAYAQQWQPVAQGYTQPSQYSQHAPHVASHLPDLSQGYQFPAHAPVIQPLAPASYLPNQQPNPYVQNLFPPQSLSAFRPVPQYPQSYSQSYQMQSGLPQPFAQAQPFAQSNPYLQQAIPRPLQAVQPQFPAELHPQISPPDPYFQTLVPPLSRPPSPKSLILQQTQQLVQANLRKQAQTLQETGLRQQELRQAQQQQREMLAQMQQQQEQLKQQREQQLREQQQRDQQQRDQQRRDREQQLEQQQREHQREQRQRELQQREQQREQRREQQREQQQREQQQREQRQREQREQREQQQQRERQREQPREQQPQQPRQYPKVVHSPPPDLSTANKLADDFNFHSIQGTQVQVDSPLNGVPSMQQEPVKRSTTHDSRASVQSEVSRDVVPREFHEPGVSSKPVGKSNLKQPTVKTAFFANAKTNLSNDQPSDNTLPQVVHALSVDTGANDGKIPASQVALADPTPSAPSVALVRSDAASIHSSEQKLPSRSPGLGVSPSTSPTSVGSETLALNGAQNAGILPMGEPQIAASIPPMDPRPFVHNSSPEANQISMAISAGLSRNMETPEPLTYSIPVPKTVAPLLTDATLSSTQCSEEKIIAPATASSDLSSSSHLDTVEASVHLDVADYRKTSSCSFSSSSSSCPSSSFSSVSVPDLSSNSKASQAHSSTALSSSSDSKTISSTYEKKKHDNKEANHTTEFIPITLVPLEATGPKRKSRRNGTDTVNHDGDFCFEVLPKPDRSSKTRKRVSAAATTLPGPDNTAPGDSPVISSEAVAEEFKVHKASAAPISESGSTSTAGANAPKTQKAPDHILPSGDKASVEVGAKVGKLSGSQPIALADPDTLGVSARAKAKVRKAPLVINEDANEGPNARIFKARKMSSDAAREVSGKLNQASKGCQAGEGQAEAEKETRTSKNQKLSTDSAAKAGEVAPKNENHKSSLSSLAASSIPHHRSSLASLAPSSPPSVPLSLASLTSLELPSFLPPSSLSSLSSLPSPAASSNSEAHGDALKLEALTFRELQLRCKALGVKASGKREELLARLQP